MKIFRMFLLLILVSQATIFAAYELDEILMVPWGNAAHEISLTETPVGWKNIESFEVMGSDVYLMASNDGQILHFSGESYIKRLDTGLPGLRDFKMGENGTLAFLLDSKVMFQKQGQIFTPFWVNTEERRVNSRILRSNQNRPSVLVNRSMTLTPGSGGENRTQGVLNRNQQPGRMIREDDRRMTFVLDGQEVSTFNPRNGVWGSGQYLDSDDAGHHYILLETILNNYPLELHREVRILNGKGQTIGRIEVPPFQHVLVSREFQIQADGTIYGMITSSRGVHVLQWSPTQLKAEAQIDLPLPVEYRGIVPRPFTGDSELPRPVYDEKDAESLESPLRMDFPPVGRDESVATGETYVELVWTASEANITNGLIQDPDGNDLQTPYWVQVGQNHKVVYQWGGFSTITGFENGLLDGKSAGDMATSDISQHAVGVDCSGFVSRCWNMDQHYSTWMMSNVQPLITQPLPSWYDLSAGDAIHKVGHVRLMVLWNTNGTMLAVEAGGSWITDYHVYSLAQLGDYGPRYYVYMEGMPASLPQPTLGGVLNGDHTTILWSLEETTGIQGVNLYERNIHSDDDWGRVNAEVIPADQTSISLQSSDLALAWELRSVSEADSTFTSYPSDAYAAADKSSSEELLIVDGFDRNTGSYPFPYHDFACRMAESLDQFLYSYATVDNDRVIAGDVSLSDYEAIFWLLGDESTLHETFSFAEQALIRDYLEGGGRLFISGSEVAWDLDAQGSSADETFLRNYLKASYQSDDSQNYEINGVDGTSFAGLQLSYDDGNDGVYEEDYPDAFTPVNGSIPVLRYENNLIAAVAYTGLFGNGSETGKVVLLGIPFETIYNADQRFELTRALLDYFSLSTLLSSEPEQLPERELLLEAYPNPFNSGTNLAFKLPVSESVELSIYDVQGREVTRLLNGDLQAGKHSIHLNTEDWPSAVYLVNLRTAESSMTRRIIHLK